VALVCVRRLPLHAATVANARDAAPARAVRRETTQESSIAGMLGGPPGGSGPSGGVVRRDRLPWRVAVRRFTSFGRARRVRKK